MITDEMADTGFYSKCTTLIVIITCFANIEEAEEDWPIGARAGGARGAAAPPPPPTEITGFFGQNAHDSCNDT